MTRAMKAGRVLPALALILGMALTAALMGAPAAAAGRRTVRPPEAVVRPAAGMALADGLAWALGQAPSAAKGRAFWVGYAIDRLQGERSSIGWFDGPPGAGGRLTIADVLAGKTAPPAAAGDGEAVRKAAKAALEEIDGKGKPEKMVLKELGFFLKYETGRPPVLAEARMSNLDLAMDFEGLTLFWLGKAAEDRSLALVEKLFGAAARTGDLRENLLAAAGCHGTPALVVPFLVGVMEGDGDDETRKNAAFWLGQQNDADGLRRLVRAAKSDRSEEVREGAVFAVSQVELPAAVDEIIALARGAEKRDVRKQAVFWLGQMASKKSAAALEEFARKDGDREVQEHAVFALSQLPDNGGVEPLVKLAKTHPDPQVRKKAVFWLGECDDPRALEALIAIVKGK
ncbi:MAG: HEAT repeat domain-containing protein [Acidobacteria bacterium]|nr:HEAT repeat domain-containing protein [Acidobacteriota bacterium]